MPRIDVMACYQAAVDKIEAKVNIMVDNPSPDAPMILEHLYWIDKNDNDRLMLFNELITFPRIIAAGECEVRVQFCPTKHEYTNFFYCFALQRISVSSAFHSKSFKQQNATS